MKRLAPVLLVLAGAVPLVVAGLLAYRWATAPPPEPDAFGSNRPDVAPLEAHPSVLYGRVTTDDGSTYEGPLRFGGHEEMFWGDHFNGTKDENPWAADVPPERLVERRPRKFLGVELDRERRIDLERPFMVRFGDIERVERKGGRLEVTLKSGTVFDLDRFGADDFGDGVRVWDGSAGVVDLEETRIRTIEFLASDGPGDAVDRLHGTVRTSQGDFTGFVRWNRTECLGTDELAGNTPDGRLDLRFDTIRSIARHSGDSSLVTLDDGREIVLSGTREVGKGNRGIYVDDPRYGRVLISWDAFERVDFSPGGAGPAYDDFPPGRPLTGSVTTRGGQRFTGRLVYDLDESETTETLDAPIEGVNYTIPFGLIASIVPAGGDADRIQVTLRSGEELRLERRGDLGDENAGMLIFIDDRARPVYVVWSDIVRVELDRTEVGVSPLEEG
ncbi:MAG: hypothetical protein GTN89_15100 [Acidobacteria bacterium]|nr:hypothetical protein [Acidobacteriota bacterium]NIM61536.1 hypothetical protein [Acidobacteriota bacterium]NIO60547.1 hypothetical protein [Acidobacteriota bacterium]NIQ31654.1 hypothetical protein [Acidobacteriota bacterium]NIQ86893.1 hypothetical protein [Acidobacteriota bacterium]